MHSLAELSKHLELGVTYSAGQLAERIHYGAGPDLLTLLNLKGVGRVRARKLSGRVGKYAQAQGRPIFPT